MFKWVFKKWIKEVEEETKKGFSTVKKDMDVVGTWVKHLSGQDKQLFNVVEELKTEISTIKEELGSVRDSMTSELGLTKSKQLFKKTANLDKQTAVYAVDNAVQTPVQTGNFYDILKSLSSNERLLIFTLLNAEEGMKLSYEDLALMLGKERATIRGQVNTIKQKSEGLIEEIIEKNGKKRVYVPEFLREKLSKYAKVRAKRSKGSD